jgi:hypothetical protein
LDDKSETNKNGGTRTSGPKSSHMKWTNFKELGKYENLSGSKHYLPVGSSEKDFFELFVTSDFYNKVAEEINKVIRNASIMVSADLQKNVGNLYYIFS